jgi:hypothetical protein
MIKGQVETDNLRVGINYEFTKINTEELLVVLHLQLEEWGGREHACTDKPSLSVAHVYHWLPRKQRLLSCSSIYREVLISLFLNQFLKSSNKSCLGDHSAVCVFMFTIE